MFVDFLEDVGAVLVYCARIVFRASDERKHNRPDRIGDGRAGLHGCLNSVFETAHEAHHMYPSMPIIDMGT